MSPTAVGKVLAEHDHKGFAYAYQYPGLIRVMQAAGRVIHTEQDRGVILLIDERMSQPRYTRLFRPNGGISRWCGLRITFKKSYAISGSRISDERLATGLFQKLYHPSRYA